MAGSVRFAAATAGKVLQGAASVAPLRSDAACSACRLVSSARSASWTAPPRNLSTRAPAALQRREAHFAAAAADATAPSTSRSGHASDSAQTNEVRTAQARERVSEYSLPNALALKGLVISVGKMDKTSKVSVERTLLDHKTLKVITRHKKYLVHDPSAECVVGDEVLIRNCKPVSKRKRFELVAVLKGAKERAVQSDDNVVAASELATPEPASELPKSAASP